MKLQIRLFISFFIILLSGYAGLSARTSGQDCFKDLTAKSPEKFQEAGVYRAESDITNYASCHVEKLNDKTYTTDNDTEENELTSSKKWLELNNYFTAVLLTQVPEHIYHTIKKRLFFYKHFLFLPACKRYIVFRVIRI